jgi:hypothetical protein
MKNLFLISSIIALLSFKIADVFSDLNTTKVQAQEDIISSISNGYLNYPSACAKIALASRASIVQIVGNFAKSYSKTDDFKKRYAEWWKNQEPKKPETPEERIAKESADMQGNSNDNGQKEMVDNMKKLISDTKDVNLKKQYEDALKGIVEMQAQMKKQLESPEYKEQMKQVKESALKIYTDEYKTQMEEYNNNFANWKAIQNPSILIKKRLKDFLELSASVDFNAQLKNEQYGKKQFVNEDYQQKDDNWKRCFRAGKPAVDASRAIAQDWLKEL